MPILTVCISDKLGQYSQFVFPLEPACGAVRRVEAVLQVDARLPDEVISTERVVVPDLHLQDARHRQRYVKLKPPARPDNAAQRFVRKRSALIDQNFS